jgi:hypothetical protein
LADGAPAHLELLLLPFSARAHAPLSLTGLLAPMERPAAATLGAFHLTSWRTIGQPPRRFLPRALRKWSLARGLTIYEGLRCADSSGDRRGDAIARGPSG